MFSYKYLYEQLHLLLEIVWKLEIFTVTLVQCGVQMFALTSADGPVTDVPWFTGATVSANRIEAKSVFVTGIQSTHTLIVLWKHKGRVRQCVFAQFPRTFWTFCTFLAAVSLGGNTTPSQRWKTGRRREKETERKNKITERGRSQMCMSTVFRE